MRSKEAFASSRGTGYFCSVATDHPAPFRRVTPRRTGVCHDPTGMERHDKDALGALAFSAGGDGGGKSPELPTQRTRRLRQPANEPSLCSACASLLVTYHRFVQKTAIDMVALKPTLVAAAAFRRQGGHDLKSDTERRRQRRAVNALGHASDERKRLSGLSMIASVKYLAARQCLSALALILSLVALDC